MQRSIHIGVHWSGAPRRMADGEESIAEENKT